MAKNNCTPVDFWLGCALSEFGQWIKANNAVRADEEEARKKK